MIKTVIIAIAFVLSGCSVFAQNTLIEGKWEITKVESPDYDKLKAEFKVAKNQKEKETLQTTINLYEHILNSYKGTLQEYKTDGTCIIEMPDFFSSSPGAKDIVNGKWTISKDNTTITIATPALVKKEGNATTTIAAKNDPYQILNINNTDLALKGKEGNQIFIFHFIRK